MKARDKSEKVQMEFQGLSINSGGVLSLACLYSAERHRAVVEYSLESKKQVNEELKRLKDTIEKCSKELDSIAENVGKRLGKAESEIFITQKHIINDPAIVKKIKGQIVEEKRNAENAISVIFSNYEEEFSRLDNEYLRERSSDISEIRRRLLDHLRNSRLGFICEGQVKCTRGKNRIIVAEELTVGMMAHMSFEKVMGFVTEHGGISSHAAIVARSIGVPAVSGIKGIMDYVKCGDPILIDGDNGRVFLEPDDETIASVIPAERKKEDTSFLIPTPKGMELLANASILEDVKMASSMNADGIGLFRTEILFITVDRLLDEKEQYDYYLKVMNQMNGKPVTFRLLDIGGDKALPFLSIEKETNPYLGWRGARFLLESPEIFDTQVRALARLSKKGLIKILFPMIIDAKQQEELIKKVKEIFLTIDSKPENLQLGAMFEVPSACLNARDIFKLIDFGSIGSNDLIQYLFAVDRNNERVSQDYNPDHPVLWDILKFLADAAKDSRKPLSICGEMAGQKGMPEKFIETGIKSLSVSPRLIPRVRNEMIKYSSTLF